MEQAKQGAAYAESVQMAAEKVKTDLQQSKQLKTIKHFTNQCNAAYIDFVEANKMKFGSGGEALLRVLVYFSDSKSGTQSIDIKTRGIIIEDASRYLNKIYDAIGTEKAWTVENATNRRMFVEAMYGKTRHTA